jgi:hypothetical protein
MVAASLAFKRRFRVALSRPVGFPGLLYHRAFMAGVGDGLHMGAISLCEAVFTPLPLCSRGFGGVSVPICFGGWGCVKLFELPPLMRV